MSSLCRHLDKREETHAGRIGPPVQDDDPPNNGSPAVACYFLEITTQRTDRQTDRQLQRNQHPHFGGSGAQGSLKGVGHQKKMSVMCT